MAVRENCRGTLPETNPPHHGQPRAGGGRVPFPDHGEQHRSGEEGKRQSTRAHDDVDIMTPDNRSGKRSTSPHRDEDESIPMKQIRRSHCSVPYRVCPHPMK